MLNLSRNTSGCIKNKLIFTCDTIYKKFNLFKYCIIYILK